MKSFKSVDSISDKDMNVLADSIESYIELLDDVLITPKKVYDPNLVETKESVKIVKDLIKRLRKGDHSVFKDIDD